MDLTLTVCINFLGLIYLVCCLHKRLGFGGRIVRNRLNKMEPEGKTHYKLYKSGRRWVTAGITVFSVGIGLTFSQVGQAKAATNSDTDETENSATVSSNSPTETKNAVVLKSSSAAAKATATSKDVTATAVSVSTASGSQSIATPAASTSRAVSGAATGPLPLTRQQHNQRSQVRIVKVQRTLVGRRQVIPPVMQLLIKKVSKLLELLIMPTVTLFLRLPQRRIRTLCQ